ncbi:hypothetical protein CTI12_AA420200 [Artemisia annua]|uniref:TOD1/MUCI70 glycosyltransferase-like domain-containing protein n=1 Tax=Artemisia annua TaxID=35608 RepID=A0A2U1M4R8_ARTAN|nr:hypothetical protein CTI12_AA420200 [Artemisia annua]
MLPERRGVIVGSDVNKGADHNSDHGLRAVRRSRRFGRRRLLFWLFSFAAICSICIAVFGFKVFFHGVEDHQSIPTLTSVKEILTSVEDVPVEPETMDPPKKKPPRGRFYPCKVELRDSVNELVEPKVFGKFVNFSLNYVAREDRPSLEHPITPRFGGHQTLEEREQSFHAANQTIHCGFVEGSEGSPSTGFDLDKEDKMYMNTCTVVVSSCIFGSSDFLRRPTSKLTPKNPFQVVRITDVPEGSFIIRAHTPMSNLFSCLWFNEVDRFTSRDQLSFGYTFLKLKTTNPDKPLVLHMFKDCERRAITKLFHHRNP